MLSQHKNRVQAIKNKFENLNAEPVLKNNSQLSKLTSYNEVTISGNGKENVNDDFNKDNDSDNDWAASPNLSYLYSKSDVKRSASETRKTLVRQTSDPGKKLHRSHAFRCDRSKIVSPKRHGSCNGRSETMDFALKGEKKLSKDRLKRLGNLLEDQMKKENFVVPTNGEVIIGHVLEVNDMPINSIPDSEVPRHILDQYAKVIKPKRHEPDKQDGMTDSGVSSETENLDDEKSGRIKKLMSQFEKSDSVDEKCNLANDLSVSVETMKLERKNPHLTLTDTLKKALKQPLPPGPPPKKPPRVFATSPILESPEKQKKDTKKMLEKLEQVLQKREAENTLKSTYSDKSVTLKKPKEIHYLCTEILDITNKTLLPNSANCFKSLNCAITNNSTLSLPYTGTGPNNDCTHRESLKFCTCSNESLELNQNNLTTFFKQKCAKCQLNDQKNDQFKCHLNCKCAAESSQFFVDNEHIYDEPFNEEFGTVGRRSKVKRSKYGTLNHSKSMEDLRSSYIQEEKIYDIPCDISRPETPEDTTTTSPQHSETKSETPHFHTENASSYTGNASSYNENASSYTEKASSYTKNASSYTGNASSYTGNASSYNENASSYTEKASSYTEAANSPKPNHSCSELPKSDFEKLRRNFEMGCQNDTKTHKNSVKFDVTNEKRNSTNSICKTSKKRDSAFLNGTIDQIFGAKDASGANRLSVIDIDKSTNTITNEVGNRSDDTRQNGIKNRKSINDTILNFVSPEELNKHKPPMRPKPFYVKRSAKSTEDLLEGKVEDKKKFLSEGRRYRERDANRKMSLQKKDNAQLDVDKENLNRLMNEIYETVTACNMADKPGSFPTDHSDGSTSEDSVKLTRSLTEKRKNYVRRVSSRVAYLDTKNIKQTRYRHQTSICSYKSEIVDNPYSTFRSWKSFRTSQNNLPKMERSGSTDSKFNLTDSSGNILSMKNDFDSSDATDNMSIDEKTGCVDIELPFEPREKGLFNVCLLVGLNHMTGQAYVKSVFPSQVQVPPHIENLIFPETLTTGTKKDWSSDAKSTQCYSLVLTDERGERSYGYCRRVLPEGATTCLPLCYCLIGKYRAPGFYYKVLQELESHHGSSDIEINSILQQLFEIDFPNPGEEVTISYSKMEDQNHDSKSKTMPDMRRSGQSDCDRSESDKSELRKCDSDKTSIFYDLENNNSLKKVFLGFDGPRLKTIKRPIEPRVDEDNLSVLLDALGAGLTIKVFGSLLLERKVLIVGDQLSLVSSCMEALQSSLYPFVWQQPLISTIPSEIQKEVLEAPLPLLAGMLISGELDTAGVQFEEGMLIDLTHPSKVLFYQGDESTILPTSSYKTLKTALQMETKKDRSEDSKTRNVMISEAFLRFFVDILDDFWKYFSVGELKEGGLGKGDVIFDKESYIKNASTKQNQYFLEWFTETAIFNHFIQNMAVCHQTSLDWQTSDYNRQTSDYSRQTSDYNRQTSDYNRQTSDYSRQTSEASIQSMTSNLVDTPLPEFYELFNERVRCRRNNNEQKFDKSNYKNAMNKRMRLLKTKLRELIT